MAYIYIYLNMTCKDLSEGLTLRKKLSSNASAVKIRQ